MGKELINILETDFENSDERGSLVQLVHKGFSQVNVLFSKKGAVRGGHYHKINREAFYVVYGDLLISAEKNGHSEERRFNAGSFFELEPETIHSFSYYEDTLCVQMYDKGVELPNGGMDTYPAGAK